MRIRRNIKKKWEEKKEKKKRRKDKDDGDSDDDVADKGTLFCLLSMELS